MPESPAPAATPAPPWRVVLACNPQAGRHSPGRLATLTGLLERHGHAVRLEDSLHVRLSPAAAANDLTCLVGGDGTARAVVAQNRETAHRATFAIFPTGTVNLIARELQHAADGRALAQRLADGAPRRHFYGELDGQPFLCCASVGIDALVVDRVSPRLKRRLGRLAYALALARLLWRWPRPRLTVTIAGVAHPAEAAFVCKGRYYAGPWVLDHAADLRADHFRVLLLPRARRRDLVRLFLAAALSPRFAAPEWRRFATPALTIDADAPLPIQADGDVIAATPADLRIAPRPLNFL